MAGTNAGFTLVEIIIATLILTITTGVVLSLLIQSLKTSYYDMGRLAVNRDIRTLTNQLTTKGTYCDSMFLLKDFSSRTATPNGQLILDQLKCGEVGDFLLLAWKDPTDSLGLTINRLAGYYRDPASADPTQSGPVRTFDITVSPSVNANSLWTAIPGVGTIHTNRQILSLTDGLAIPTTTLAGASIGMFFNYNDNSFVVSTKIIHQSVAGKPETDSYNFTVECRNHTPGPTNPAPGT